MAAWAACFVFALVGVAFAQEPTPSLWQAYTTHSDTPPGVSRLPILYRSALLTGPNQETIDPQNIAERINGIPGGSLVCLNVEHWRLHSEAEVRKNLPRYLELIRATREARPDLRLGLYGVVPIRNYWSPVLDARQNNNERTKKWRAQNDRLQKLADEVDVLMPSIYAFYDNQEEWQIYAKANIAEAKRLAQNKPVLPFVWGLYHPSNLEKSMQPVSEDYAETMLTTVLHADGVVVWTSEHRQRQKDFPILESLGGSE